MEAIGFATDYDGTLATDGHVEAAVLDALDGLRAAGARLVLVTGRERGDLERVFPALDRFDRVVVENGAVVLTPATGEQRALAPPAPAALIDSLRREKVVPLSVGVSIVATREPHGGTVARALRALALPHRVILNKGAVMVLPPGVDKATGLRVALAELGVRPERTVAVGDAENDLDFLGCCGLSVAVANALPEVRDRADLVTRGARGAGVVELIDSLLAGGRVRWPERQPRRP